MEQTTKVINQADFTNAYLEVDDHIVNHSTERVLVQCYNPNLPALHAIEKEITFGELAAAMFADRRGMVPAQDLGTDEEWPEYYLDAFQGMDAIDQYDLLAHIINKREGRRSPLEIKESHIGVQQNPFNIIDFARAVVLGSIPKTVRA